MFINFTSAVIVDGAVFGRRCAGVVSKSFNNNKFMSDGFRWSHTVCDCFEK